LLLATRGSDVAPLKGAVSMRDPAAFRLQKAADRLQCRRLSCPIRAEQRDDLATPHGQIDAVQSPYRAAIDNVDIANIKLKLRR
jgi:hypothetical protein